MNSIFFVLLCAISVSPQEIKHHIIIRSTEQKSSSDDWWKTAIFYQIYPRSFMDYNNDGTGDLQGILQKLGHLKDMGVTAAWLSPVFKSPQVDQGYDISNYREIDPIFGDLNDLKELIDQAHKLDIKIILDFVPNHTSSEHDWFIQSILGNEDYADFYIWRNGIEINGTMAPPNNWISVFKDSAWTYNKERHQYYLHQFAEAQPDLNYRNPKVADAMKDILSFWLNFGADGFRMDAVPFLFEDDEFKDEPLSGISGYSPTDYEFLKHVYTKDQDETYDMIYQFRQILDDYNKNADYPKIMMTEAYTDTIEEAMKYYVAPNGSTLGAHFTFNFNLITDIKSGFTIEDLIKSINKWLSNIPKGCVSNWVIGNHDNSRVATRLGKENVDAFNMLEAFLPGIQVTYNGEEIGMEDGEVECSEGWDPEAIKNCSTFKDNSRDFERTPFHWDNTTNAGFNNGTKTWLPVSQKHMTNNLLAQSIGIKSHYNLYKSLAEFRNNFKNLSYDAVSLIELPNNVLEIIRSTNKGTFIYLLNNDDIVHKADPIKPQGSLRVLLASVDSRSETGETFAKKQILEPHESIIFELTSSSNVTCLNILLTIVLLAAINF